MTQFPPLNERISLTNFTQRIAYLVNGREGVTDIWVTAEITDLSKRGNGHGYCTLVEKDQYGRSVATLRATIWQNNFAAVTRKFYAATGQPLSSGMKVALQLSASMHPLYGLSANVRDIDPSYTLGDMERIRREILAMLQKEGLYDRNKELTLPVAPQRIAIISADGAAGYGDFMRQIDSSPYKFYTLLYPAVMQGERTVPTVMAALDRIEETIDFWDCVVIIRGGGATTDLNSFDNIDLARRVATFPLPVIVGIGHERDNTVLDYIAHTRCKTPTAVAAFLIDRLTEVAAYADSLVRSIADRAQQIVSVERERLSHREALVPLLAKRHLDNQEKRLQRLQGLLSQVGSQTIAGASRQLSEIEVRLNTIATRLIERNRNTITSFAAIVRESAMQRLATASLNLDNTSRLIAVLSPEATLSRGYSITRVNGHAVRSASAIPPGTILSTTLSDGTILSRTLDPNTPPEN